MIELLFNSGIGWWIIGGIVVLLILGGSGQSGVYDGQETGTDWNEYHARRDEEERIARDNGKPEWPRGNE